MNRTVYTPRTPVIWMEGLSAGMRYQIISRGALVGVERRELIIVQNLPMPFERQGSFAENAYSFQATARRTRRARRSGHFAVIRGCGWSAPMEAE